MAELKLEIITPYKSMFSGIIKSITIPGTVGSFQILINHAPLISTFECDIIKIVLFNDDVIYYTTSGGTVEVLDNKVLVLADTIENVKDLDEVRAKRAKMRAQERLANREDKRIDVHRAEVALQRAVNRLNAIEKYIKSEV
ncbi:MAG: ATP synthase F1 subunit epsilon [Bacteroidota bacterium]|nr:ATP synthase F1 subunit epsilon [Bacteroidota bacterium]